MINQLACPGLGTILAGRRVGYFQTALMVVGFVLTMGFMACYFSSLIGFALHSGGAEPNYRQLVRPYAWAGWTGLGCCAVAWCWAGVSSISMMRAAK